MVGDVDVSVGALAGGAGVARAVSGDDLGGGVGGRRESGMGAVRIWGK